MKSLVSPVCNSVDDAVSFAVRGAHDLCTLIPYTLAIAASIEEMFFGFFLLLEKHTEGGSDEATFPEIVPSQGPVVHY